MKKILAILLIGVAWFIGGMGVYFVFVKGFNFIHFAILVVGIISIIFAERKLKQTFMEE